MRPDAGKGASCRRTDRIDRPDSHAPAVGPTESIGGGEHRNARLFNKRTARNDKVVAVIGVRNVCRVCTVDRHTGSIQTGTIERLTEVPNVLQCQVIPLTT